VQKGCQFCYRISGSEIFGLGSPPLLNAAVHRACGLLFWTCPLTIQRKWFITLGFCIKKALSNVNLISYFETKMRGRVIPGGTIVGSSDSDRHGELSPFPIKNPQASDGDIFESNSSMNFEY
jgi:hypothetical protein